MTVSAPTEVNEANFLPNVEGLSNAEAAEAYADAGVRVVPVIPGTKNPGSYLGKGWPQLATSDLGLVRDWWRRWPHAGIAMHVGGSGLIVLDVDHPDKVPGSLWQLLGQGLFRPTTSQLASKRGHYVFRLPPGRRFGCGLGGLKSPAGERWGEVKCFGGAIVLGPTRHPRSAEGGHYATGPGGLIPMLPNEIADKLTAPPEPETFRLLTRGDLEASAKRFLATYTDDREPWAIDPIIENFDSTAGGRHASMWETLCWGLREAKAGRFCAQHFINLCREMWADAFDVAGRVLDAEEFNRMVHDAAHVADHDGTPRELWERAHRRQEIDEDAFWSSSTRLSDLRVFARARRVGPWAMLGSSLARTVAVIPPHVVLPPLVGGVASLNFFVALVGRSGEAKSASMSASADWLTVEPNYPTAKPGSGEGLAKCFAYVRAARSGNPPMQIGKQWSVLAQIQEVDTLTATGGRGGATIMGELRSAWSGERIGLDYAAADKRIVLREHRYRLCLMVGVQPLRAQPLFDDADGGTPQRFIWMPARDADAPQTRPDEPTGLDLGRWHEPQPSGVSMDRDLMRASKLADAVDPADFRVLAVPHAAQRAIDRHQLATLRGDSRVNPLDGHALLCRLKVAAALMALEGRQDRITNADWKRAGTVMQVSNRTRCSVLADLKHRKIELNEQRGRFEGERADIAEQTKTDRAVSRVAKNITKYLRSNDGSMARSAVREKLHSRDRSHFDDAETLLINLKQLVKVPSGNCGPDGFVLLLPAQNVSK